MQCCFPSFFLRLLMACMRRVRIFVRYREPGQAGTEGVTIISCGIALRVVMHYYERGNFPRARGADGATQKPRIPIGTSGRKRRENGHDKVLAIALQQAGREKKLSVVGSEKSVWASRQGSLSPLEISGKAGANRRQGSGKSGAGSCKKKLSRWESANLKGDLGKFEETAASPSRAGYGSLPVVI